MPKVVFFFAGTGDEEDDYYEMKEEQHTFQNSVIRIYIKGCQEERVGNSALFPDLDIAANNIRNAFEGNSLNLNTLKENFGNGLSTIVGQNSGQLIVNVEDITLEGFSRGAVTTFATAKKLDDLNIPMHIIANQPVPGEPSIAKRLYSRYCDLSKCHNIKSAHTFLGTYNLEQGFVHNYFFQQMVAKFPVSAHAQKILCPHQDHFDWYSESPIPNHINKIMAENGLTRPAYDEFAIRKWYKKNKNYYFTPNEFMQNIYGGTPPFYKDPIYLNVLISDAKKCLAANHIHIEKSIQPEQASAIMAIAQLEDNRSMSHETKIKLYKLILKNSKRAEQFVKIVNKITEICDYLPHVTKDVCSRKEMKIMLHANEYKTAVFLHSFEFLSKNKPSREDRKQFAAHIYKAECKFRAQALSIDRSVMRIILKILTNFITHITGVALIVNTINKIKTGNWFFFNHNRSENAVRNIRKTLLKDMDKLDTDSDQDKTDHSRDPKSSAP